MTMMPYTVLFTTINLVLISTLLSVYIRNYRQLRASFSLGLLLFASIFLFQKVAAVFLYLVFMYHFSDPVGAYLLLLEILQTVAFSILTWITMK